LRIFGFHCLPDLSPDLPHSAPNDRVHSRGQSKVIHGFIE
jgi:hypothetical protein